MTTQPADTHSFSCNILSAALSGMMVSLFSVSAAYAESPASTNSPKTPALVVPVEEATKDIAPISKEKAAESPKVLSSDVDTDGGSLAGDFLSSYVAHSQGDVSSAVKYLKESLSKDPSNQGLANQLLILELMHGQVDDAIELAKKLSTYAEHELIVDLLLTVDATKKSDYVKASSTLKKAASSSFEHIWLPLLLGWLEPSSSKNDKPVALLPETIVDDKNTIPSFIYYHTALINNFRGASVEARSQLQASIKDLSRAPFRALLAYTQMRASENDRESLQQLLIDLDAQRPDMAELLRRELPYLRNLSDGTELPKTALVSTQQEGVAEVLLTMASMLYTLDTSQDIPLYLQLALYLKPEFPTAQLMLGNYYETTSLLPEALKQYQKIPLASPLYLKAGIRRAYIAEATKKPEQAEEIIDGLIRQFPTSLELLMAKGDMYRNRGSYTEAITYYDKAIAAAGTPLAKDHWVILFARGACFERIKNYAKAESDMKQALALAPNQPEVLNYIGYMLLDQDKDIEQAIKFIQQAYDASPNQPHIIDSLGWAYVRTGKLEEGIALLENAAEVLPNDATINEHLGDAYWFAERELEAKFQWQRALEYLEDNSRRPMLEARIANGLTTYSFHTLATDKTSDSSGTTKENTIDKTTTIIPPEVNNPVSNVTEPSVPE